MKKDKKNFVFTIKTYGNDLKKRWRVEYYDRGIRKVAYGNINTAKTIEERIKRANKIIEELKSSYPTELNILDAAMAHGSFFWRKKTVSTYNTVVKKLKEYAERNKLDISKINSTHINNFLLAQIQLGKNVNTVAKYRTTLFTIFKMCVDLELIEFNIVEKVRGFKKSPRSLMYFSLEQINKIKDAVIKHNPQLWLAIRFTFYCYIRPGELRFLKINNLDFENGIIEIPASISKNKKTQRVVIPVRFLKEIQYLREYNNNNFILSAGRCPGPVPVSANYLNTQHRKVLDLVKIKGNYAFYSWKHTGVVLAVRAGLNIKDIQLQLRHHSLDMVNEYLKNLGLNDSELKNRFPTI